MPTVGQRRIACRGAPGDHGIVGCGLHCPRLLQLRLHMLKDLARQRALLARESRLLTHPVLEPGRWGGWGPTTPS